MSNDEKEHPLTRKLFNGYNEKFLNLKADFNHIVLENIAAGQDPVVAVTKILTEIKRLIVNIELCVPQLNISDVDKDLILHNLYVDFDECIEKHDMYLKHIDEIVNKKIPARFKNNSLPKKIIDLNDISIRHKMIAFIIFVKDQYNFNIKRTSSWFQIPMSTVGKYRQTYLKMKPVDKMVIDAAIAVMKNSCKNSGDIVNFYNEWIKS